MKTLFVIIILFASCKAPMQAWERSGSFIKHDKAYVFHPYEQWHTFDSTRALPDTVYEFMYAHNKPKY